MATLMANVVLPLYRCMLFLPQKNLLTEALLEQISLGLNRVDSLRFVDERGYRD
jgi:hypothetical protein